MEIPSGEKACEHPGNGLAPSKGRGIDRKFVRMSVVVQFQTGRRKGGLTLEAQRHEESTQANEALNLFAFSFASLRLCVKFLPDKDGPQLQPEPLPECRLLPDFGRM
ncbi:MAG TPA: hypothetical protein VGC87_14525 [Pyrinomonadaceae bacterium]|jgi:hypothetical protein